MSLLPSHEGLLEGREDLESDGGLSREQARQLLGVEHGGGELHHVLGQLLTGLLLHLIVEVVREE